MGSALQWYKTHCTVCFLLQDDSKQRPKTPIVSGNTFGIELELEFYEFLEKQALAAKSSAKKNKNKGQAHHMFSRFLNLQFFHEIFFALFF